MAPKQHIRLLGGAQSGFIRPFSTGVGKTAYAALLVFLGATCAPAQENAPIGIVRGDFLAWSGTQQRGVVTLLSADQRVLACGFDDKTWFEHDDAPVSIRAAHAGDHLEIVADRRPFSAACYARTVQIVDVALPRRTASGKPRLRSYSLATEPLAPRGDITFAGIVTGIDGSRITVRTRAEGREVFLLRPDTRYLGGGFPRERASLARQMLVYVRAGRNVDGDIEAYTIVWGSILDPRQ